MYASSTGRRSGTIAFTRREFLRTAVTATAPLVGCASVPLFGDEEPDGVVFGHGVASGDPLADRVVLWTRVTPALSAWGDRIFVEWRIARDPALIDEVARGAVTTNTSRDYTVKVDALGLEPGGTYYYQFSALGQQSVVGRTRTLAWGPLDRVRLGVASCANYPQGFFNAYRLMARRADLDAVVHLGDYIYEYANGDYGDGGELGRVPEPKTEIITLSEYRARHAQYKRDPDLQELHRQHPMIAVWDDHELANNAWMRGAENHDDSEGRWADRRHAAVYAYHEWMPIREAEGGGRIYRSFRFGDLAELDMLDTRLLGRDEQASRDALPGAEPGRSLLGPTQEAWLGERLSASSADAVAWRVLGQQIVMSPLALPGNAGNPDAWDGYAGARGRLFEQLRRGGIEDVVVLTGDIHSSWALDVAPGAFDATRYDPSTGRGSLAVEFVTPAVSSSTLGSFPRARELFADVEETHPHLRYLDMHQRGYLVLDLDRERAQAEWYHVSSVDVRADDESFARALATPRGANHLEPVADAATPPPAPAPAA